MTLVTLDSSVLLYAELEPDSAKGELARDLIARAAPRGILAAQALGEFLNVVRRRHPARLPGALEQIELYREVFRIAPTNAPIIMAAGALAHRHRLQLWDAVIWQAAATLGARIFLSEDLQDGLLLEGMMVLNPFANENTGKLDELLDRFA